MRRATRWILRFVATLGGLCVLSLALVIGFLHTDCGRDRVRRKVEDALAATFPGGATVGKLEGSAFTELIARDVVLNTADRQRMVHIGTLRIKMALWPLVHQTAHVDRLIAEDVDVRITGAPLSNEPPSAAPSEPSAWTVELPAFEVHRAHVVVDGAGEVFDVELAGSLEMAAGGPLTTAVRATGTWQGRRVAADVVAALGEALAVPKATLDMGKLHVAAHDVIVDGERPSGAVTIDAPGELIRELAKLDRYDMPDVHLEAVASGDNAQISATAGTATLHALVHGDLAARKGSAVISVRGADTRPITRGEIDARGDALAAFGFDGTVLAGMIYAHGGYETYPESDAHVAIRGTRDGATITLLASGPGAVAIAASAELTRDRLIGSRLVASAGDLGAATRMPGVAGRADLELQAHGTLEPLALDVTGRFDGKFLHRDDLSIGRLTAALDGVISERDGKLGAAHVVAQSISRAGSPVGNATLDARNCEREHVLVVRRDVHAIEARPRCDGDKILAQLAAQPAGTTAAVDLGATVALDTPGMLADVAIGAHHVRLPDGQVWSGAGGRVTVSDDKQVTVRDVRTANGGASLAVRADYGVATEQLDAHLDARGVPAILIDATYQGTASGTLDVHRRGAAWSGKGAFDATGLVLGPDMPKIDGKVDVAIAGRRVTVDADATADKVGGVHVAVAVDGPRDLLDTVAWRALPLTAIQDVTVTARGIDLAGVAPEVGGTVGGQVTLAGPHPTGTLAVRGVATPLGNAEAYIAFAPKAPQLGATAHVEIAGFGEAAVDGSIAFPERPFDPDAWRALGRRVLGGVDVTVENVTVAEGQLAALGLVKAPYHGRLDGKLHVAPGASDATLELALRDVAGGVLVKPIAMKVVGRAGASGTHGEVTVAQDRTQLATLTVDVPVALDRWFADPKTTAKTAPVTGALAIPELPAATLTSVLGGSAYVIGGGLSGSATVGGTLGAPTGHARLAAHDVVVAPSLSGRSVPRLEQLALTVDWDGATGALSLKGKESDGGWLDISANGRPDQPKTVVGNLGIGKFDITPFAAFLPGRYAAATGHLAGNMTVRGIDETGAVRGWVRVDDMSVPLHALLGALTNGSAQLTVDDRAYKLKAKGDVGHGKVVLDASAPRDISKIDGTLVLSKVTPILEQQPQIDATITATAVREGAIWHARARTAKGAKIFVPDSLGKELLDEETPSDLYFVDEGLPLSGFREPEKPWLYFDIGFDDVAIESRYIANVDATIYGQLELDIGETIGVFGSIGIDNGTADLFGRRYIVQDGPSKLRFDGDLDPLVDLYLETSDIPDLRLGVSVAGRLDDITEGRQPPATFTAAPGAYDQGQLLGIFMGGTPGNAAVAGGAFWGGVQLSERFRRIKQKLPFDVFSYTPSGLTLGKWFAAHRMFVDYKARLDAKPDEGANLFEAEMFLSKAWSFELSGDDKLFLGGDLLWRHRWR